MSWLSSAIVIWGVGLEAVLLARAFFTRMTRKFPIFYSYIAFILACEIFLGFILSWYPSRYATDYWLYFVTRTLAEFGVLFGVSDVIFRPFPAVRSLGRLIVILSCVFFAAWFGLPLGQNHEPSWYLFLDLIKTSAITKAIALAALLWLARNYGIAVGRNAGGILLGFAAYLTAQAATFTAALYFGRGVYAPILSWLGPTGFGICLSIWTYALWSPDPVLRPPSAGPSDDRWDGHEIQIRRLSTFVTRFLSK